MQPINKPAIRYRLRWTDHPLNDGATNWQDKLRGDPKRDAQQTARITRQFARKQT